MCPSLCGVEDVATRSPAPVWAGYPLTHVRNHLSLKHPADLAAARTRDHMRNPVPLEP